MARGTTAAKRGESHHRPEEPGGRPARKPAALPVSGRKTGGRLPRQEADQRVDRLFEIALHEFAEHGYGTTSLNRLVELSGVSKTTMFRRFGNKEGLYLALVERVSADLRRQIARLEMDPGRPEEALERFIEIFIQAAVINPWGSSLLRLAIAERNRFPTLAASMMSDANETFRILADYMQKLMDQGMLKTGDPLNVTYDFMALLSQGVRMLLDDVGYLSRPGRSAAIVQRFLKGWS
jgi:AcrR family transcriptional regulator